MSKSRTNIWWSICWLIHGWLYISCFYKKFNKTRTHLKPRSRLNNAPQRSKSANNKNIFWNEKDLCLSFLSPRLWTILPFHNLLHLSMPLFFHQVFDFFLKNSSFFISDLTSLPASSSFSVLFFDFSKNLCILAWNFAIIHESKNHNTNNCQAINCQRTNSERNEHFASQHHKVNKKHPANKNESQTIEFGGLKGCWYIEELLY